MTTNAVQASRDELAEIVRRWVSLWTAPLDWALFDALHAEDFEDGASAGRDVTRAAYAEGLREFMAAFPDARTQVDDLVIDVERQQVAVRWSSLATNRLPYLGLGPTQRQTRIRGIEIVQIAGGRIRRRWGEWDISDHRAG
jgi:steroid delta-isomerase-like uncharacterized protein